MNNNIHEKYMKLCFELAKKGAGNVNPNPLVGAVIVKDDSIISTGYHKKYGSAHAEKNAIYDASVSLSGTTLYCNLEPCMHTNKHTPPCVPAIVSGNIGRVVIANTDPNKKVNGKGIEILKVVGIEVITGILEEEGRELNRFYFKFMETGLPYVTMKIAESLDGKISAKHGMQTWLTGEMSQKYVHTQRSIYDAVLVGANTVNIDNPKLTVRGVEGRNPIRIVLDANLTSRIDSSVFNDNESRTIICCLSNVNAIKKQKLSESGVELIEFEPDQKNLINLAELLLKLASMKITSLLVEGGRHIFEQFISLELFDEILILKAPVILGKGVDSVSLEKVENLQLSKQEHLGHDILLTYSKRKS